MAPTLSDIPPDLRTPSAKSSFCSWLRSQPIPYNARRSLIYIWRQHTRRQFDHLDYIAAGLLPQTPPRP